MSKDKEIMSRREKRDVGSCIGVEMEYNSHDYLISHVHVLSDPSETTKFKYDDIVLLMRRLAVPARDGSPGQHRCYSHATLIGLTGVMLVCTD